MYNFQYAKDLNLPESFHLIKVEKYQNIKKIGEIDTICRSLVSQIDFI